ncbi:MAG: S1-like domain-containing RNA-binding protein [Verrucomicrobiota bacterium]
MAFIGKRHSLVIEREATPGLYLNDGENGEVLLPRRYIPRDYRIGDKIDVFVYMDSEDRPVATTEVPYGMAGEFACLKVVSVNRQVGAFLDWGLSKDLLLPFREQLGEVRLGQKLIVYIYLDPKTSRLVASMRTKQHLKHPNNAYKEGDAVSFMVEEATALGYNVIVQNKHHGLLFASNLSGPLARGERLKGFVHRVRPDGKIDIRLEAEGYKKITPLSEQILQALQLQGGLIPYDDKSLPEEIRKAFGVSKNTFKLALSALYRDRKIEFVEGGTKITPEGEAFLKNEWKPGKESKES